VLLRGSRILGAERSTDTAGPMLCKPDCSSLSLAAALPLWAWLAPFELTVCPCMPIPPSALPNTTYQEPIQSVYLPRNVGTGTTVLTGAACASSLSLRILVNDSLISFLNTAPTMTIDSRLWTTGITVGA
jgi:hypothetical protein